jgi:hypothetical protein
MVRLLALILAVGALAGVIACAAHRAEHPGGAAPPRGDPPVCVPMRMSEFDAPMIEVSWKAGATRQEWMVVDTGDSGTLTIYRLPPRDGEAAPARQARPLFLGHSQETPLPIEWVMIGESKREGLIGGTVERRDNAQIPGCVGLGLFRTWGVIDFDFQESTLTLASQGGPIPERMPERAIRVPLRQSSAGPGGSGVLVDGVIEAIPCAVIVDTGFNGFVAASEGLLRSLGYDTTISEPVRAITPFASYNARGVPLDRTLHLGDRAVRLAGAAMAVDPQAGAVVPENAVILGIRFLKQYRVVRVDWTRQELVLAR